MTEFKTGREMAEHLGTIINDPQLVLLAVRRRFPKYAPELGRAIRISQEDFAANGSRKPMSKFDGYMDSDLADRAHRASVTIGSARLLTAIHKQHPEIMRALGAR